MVDRANEAERQRVYPATLLGFFRRRPLVATSLESHGNFSCALVLVSCLANLSCLPDGTPNTHASNGSPSPPPPSPPPLDLIRERPWPPAYAADPLWVRASAGNDLDHARLAQRESAPSLLQAVGHGGSLGRVALRSLAYSSQRREVLPELCDLTLGADAPTLHPLLESIYDAIVNGPRTEESLAAEADVRCAGALEPLSSGAADPDNRDLAGAALAVLRGPKRP
jgi:hypothetical protein